MRPKAVVLTDEQISALIKVAQAELDDEDADISRAERAELRDAVYELENAERRAS